MAMAAAAHNRRWSSQQLIPRLILLGFLILGIFLRLYGIDHKVYGVNEVATSVRISGHTFAYAAQQLTQKAFLTIDTLQKYQYPDVSTSPIDTIRSLILENSQDPPLYFLLARQWVLGLGNSIASIRSFSAFTSIITLPALYWLCLELFKKPIVGEMAVILTAVSPLQIIYAQEARPYSLWMLLIVLSSAVLIKTLETRQISWLGFYGLLVICGLYTHLLFGFILIGHSLYVWLSEKLRITRFLMGYSLTTLLALVTFIPWLYVLSQYPPQNELNLIESNAISPYLLLRWVGILARTFIDLGVNPLSIKQLSGPFIVLSAGIAATLLGLTGYGIYHLQRYVFREPWQFVLCLLSAIVVPLALASSLWGKQLFVTQYVLPLALLSQVLMAFLLAKKLTTTQKLLKRRLWQSIVVFVLACGIFSCMIRIPAEIWWNQVPSISGDLPQIAQKINQAEQPLVIGNLYPPITMPMLQSLAYLVATKTRFQLLTNSRAPIAQGQFGTIFLLDPSSESINAVETAYHSDALPIARWVWQLEPKV